MPDEMSPYSAEGTPVITSTSSMFDEAMLRVLAPDGSPIEALVDSRTPSTSTAVPNWALPAVEPPLRSENFASLADVRSGLAVLPPGSSEEMSDASTTCR